MDDCPMPQSIPVLYEYEVNISRQQLETDLEIASLPYVMHVTRRRLNNNDTIRENAEIAKDRW